MQTGEEEVQHDVLLPYQPTKQACGCAESWRAGQLQPRSLGYASDQLFAYAHSLPDTVLGIMTTIRTGYAKIVTPPRPYCRRCDQTFDSGRARNQHYEASARHNICDVCRFDGPSRDKLVQHHRSTRHMIMCNGCSDGGWWIPDSQAYKDHLRDDNVCTICERHFDSPNNLHHHKLVHLEPSLECYGCTQSFTTYAGMILHLESGACGSGIDILDLNKSAAMCYQWRKFLDEEYRGDMLSCYDLEEYYGTVYPFMCPGCNTTFSKLSGLFQHVGSGSCEQRLNDGPIAKLVKWLSNRHAW